MLYCFEMVVTLGYKYLNQPDELEFIPLQSSQLQIGSTDVQLPWLPDLYYQLGIIIAVAGLIWLLYIIIRHRSDVMQIIEGRTKQIYILIISVYAILGIYYVFFGQLNYDEGTEIYASNLVYSGKIPYIDFMYTHGPVLPYVYGIPQFIFGSSMYVGRFTSLFFGVLTLILTAKTAERVTGKTGAVIALALVSFNLYAVYLLTSAKSYELTAFFMVLSLFFLFRNKDVGKPRDYMLSTIAMSLAAGVRLSLLPMVILLILYIVYVERKNVKTVVISAGTGIATSVLLLIPFFAINRNVAMFNLYTYYVGGNPYVTQYDKLSNFLFLMDAFLVIAVLFFLGVIILILYRQTYSTRIKFLYVGVALVYAMHLIPTENLPEHPVILVPFVAILAAFGFSEVYNKTSNNFTKYLLLLTVVIMILFTLLSNGPQWVDISGNKTPIAEVDEIATYIKNNTPKDGKLIAFSTYAAVQADRELLPGFSQAYYTYRPDWSDEKAKEYNGVNPNMLNKYIESRSASAILLTDFEIRRIGSEPVRLIEENYDLVKTTGAWGQHVNTAYLYLPKSILVSIQKSHIGYDDTQTWNVKLPPNAGYLLTLRSPGKSVIVIGSGNADANGDAGGSFVVGGNLPIGTTALRIELTSDPSIFEERTFIVEDPPGSIILTLQTPNISYNDIQSWSASGFAPHEGYVVTLRSPTNRTVIVIASGNADANGNASGSFLVGGNVPSGDNMLRIEAASLPSYYGEATFRIS